MVRYISVCSGIEALTVATQPLGWKCVLTSEIEPFPAAVVKHHYGFPNLGDMRNYLDWPVNPLAQANVIVAGTPCPSFSIAGRRKGLADDRGKLSLVFADLFHHVNGVRKNHGRPPAIALWENVPGCLTTKDNAFGHLLGRLLGCDEAPETESGKWDNAGFLSSKTVRVGWRVLDAQYFALAQRRRRVFLVAVPCELVERLGKRACPSEILSLPESVLGDPPTRDGKRQETAGGPEGEPAGNCAIEEPAQDVGEAAKVIAFNSNARGCELPSDGRDTRISDSLTASQRAAVAFVDNNGERGASNDRR